MNKLIVALLMLSVSAFATEQHPPRRICAVAYNSLNANYTSKMFVPAGTQIADLNREQVSTGGNWDNRISKVSVASGCTFIGYQYQDFNVHYNNGHDLQGFALVLSNETGAPHKTTVLGFENEKISSIKCFCNR